MATSNASVPVVAYFSHSYRPEDRSLNMAVWRRLNEAGIIFAVDPPDQQNGQPRPMDPTFAERMMQRSDCFVAVLPLRERGRWSPYQELECRIALRANKPRLIVLEKGGMPGVLADERTATIDRQSTRLSSSFDIHLKALLAQVDTSGDKRDFLPQIGILSWAPTRLKWQRLVDSLQDVLGAKHEADIFKIIPCGPQTPDQFLLGEARKLSAVVCDLNPEITPPYIYGLLHGAAIPLLRTYLLAPGEDELLFDRDVAVDESLSLLRGYRVDQKMKPVRFWTAANTVDAASAIAEATLEYRQRERQLETQDDARSYFLRLKGNRVFISTPADQNGISRVVKRKLDDEGIPAFHYEEPDALRIGEGWETQLAKAIGTSDLVLAFISDSYWNSIPCVDEMCLAVARWERHKALLLAYMVSPNNAPPFIRRIQVGRITAQEDTAVRATRAVVRAFSDDDIEALDENAGHQLSALLTRYGDLDSEVGLETLLADVCKLDRDKVTALLARLRNEPSRSSALLCVLLDGLAVEAYASLALARICYYLRGLVPERSSRDFLSSLFSQLRLLPNLHDVRAWNKRNERRVERIVLADHSSTEIYSLVTALAAGRADWGAAISTAGLKLATEIKAETWAKLLANERVRVCAEVNLEQLMLPIEWAMHEAFAAPLSRSRPVYRQIKSLDANSRSCLEDAFHDGKTGPPRVLIFGHPTPELRNVEQELRDVRDLFVNLYREREWPDSLVKSIDPAQATREVLQNHLVNSDYEILHFAGHAGFLEGKPAIAVAGHSGGVDWVSGAELCEWLRDSSVRFVYFNCCLGAASELREAHASWGTTLCRGGLEGGVPEIVAYLWPVSDRKSARFAKRFYAEFLRSFDAPFATWSARRDSPSDDPIWAASVLIKQPPAS